MLQPLEGGQGTRCWESEVEKGSGNRTEAFAFVSALAASVCMCKNNKPASCVPGE